MSPIVTACLIGIGVGGFVGILGTLLGFNIFERLAARRTRRALERDEFWSREVGPPG